AWLDARRRLSMTGDGIPPPGPENDAQPPPARAENDTPRGDTEAAGAEHAPDTEPADEPESGPADEPESGPADEPDAAPETEPAGEPAPGPAGESTPPASAPSHWRRQGPLVAIAACTVAGILTLALWPHASPSEDDRADSAPSSAPPSSTAPRADAKSPRPGASPTASRSATAEPAASPADAAASPVASPIDHDETIPTPAPTPRPTPERTVVSARLPAAGWTSIHPASAPSRCLTEGRERNGRTDRELAVQHSCADSPLPRVKLEKLGGQTYRIQWDHPDHGIGCLAVDDALT
ncbi:hypothetical protein JL475_39200, partial [Streptomyces sp. M2CJ-2]|nr:hypothetical protein [Streptomyces sp. M2CJ-2]